MPIITPYTWTNHEGRLAAPRGDPFRQIRIMDGQGAEPFRLDGDGPLVVRVALEPLPADEAEAGAGAELRLLVRDGEGAVVLGGPRARLDLAGGEAIWTWVLERPRLEPGVYLLELELETAGGTHARRAPLRVGLGGVGWAELGPTEASWAEAGPTEASWAETGPTEASWAETGPTEASWAETGPTEASWAETGLGGVGWAELGPTEASWAETGPTEASWAETEAGGTEGLRSVDLEGGDDPVAPGSELRLRLTLEGLKGTVHVGLQILDAERREVARRIESAEATGPAMEARLRFHLNLLDGSYRLRCGLWDPARDRLLEPARGFDLRVKSASRREGGGLVYAPHRMWLPT
jgi:hypothetical protein